MLRNSKGQLFEHELIVTVATSNGRLSKTYLLSNDDLQAVTALFKRLEPGDRVHCYKWEVEDFYYDVMRRKYANVLTDEEFELLLCYIPEDNCVLSIISVKTVKISNYIYI